MGMKRLPLERIAAMTRIALALATLLTLTLNGSLALASIPGCDGSQGVCTVSLRMMTPPPARPANLLERHRAAMLAIVVPVAGRY